MTAFPDAGHPAKQDRDKEGQIGDRDHSMQRQKRDVGDKKAHIPVVSQYFLRRSARFRRL